MTSDRIAIIGAGPGGVCAARWLMANDIPFDILELIGLAREVDLGDTVKWLKEARPAISPGRSWPALHHTQIGVYHTQYGY